jgi:hypothetical protein
MSSATENIPPIAGKPFHYILMLEGSGGMSGRIWADLLDGVKEFVKIRMDFGLPDRITMIVFDQTAQYIYLDADIKTIDVTKIPFRCGGRAFDGAFNLVIQAMQRGSMRNLSFNSNANLEYSIIFMSDGPANFPSKQLETLLTMKMNISYFWALIIDGPGTEVSEKINQEMGGTLKKLKNLSEFLTVYAEIARH